MPDQVQVVQDVAKATDVANQAAQVAVKGAVAAQAAGEVGPSKPLYKSKTFWFNIATAGLSYAGGLPTKYQVPVAVAGNILLRFLTSQPISGVFN